MLSIVIPTNESERSVVRTLSNLIPGVMAGVVREVIFADAGSGDGTEQVADVAGCRFMTLPGPLGARLSSAAAEARGSWLMFLRPGTVLESGWVGEVEQFWMRVSDPDVIAATFRPQSSGGASVAVQIGSLLRQLLGGGMPGPDQGLILAKATYDRLGGHDADAVEPEEALMRKIGRRRIAVLPAGIG